MWRAVMLTLLMANGSLAMAEIQSSEITYTGGGVEMTGYLAWDDSIEGQRPGVIVVHEWWGQNDYPRRRARMLAELGYTALAIDMYGDRQIADHPDSAGAFMTAVIDNMEAGRARFEAGMDALKSHETVDASRLAAIGYCFGGGVVLHMARAGVGLAAVASFHGSLPLAEAPGPDQIDTRVVAYNGASDPFVNAEAIAAFEAGMQAAGADYQLVQLPGALHGFSNPAATINGEKFGLPLKYDALADQASWAHMQMVLREAFAE